MPGVANRGRAGRPATVPPLDPSGRHPRSASVPLLGVTVRPPSWARPAVYRWNKRFVHAVYGTETVQRRTMGDLPSGGVGLELREHTKEWESFAARFRQIEENVERVVRGKNDEIRLALVALVAEGHLLIEDVPGVGKTLLAKAIARSIDCSFRRIQFTPDMLPTDITGVNVFNQERGDFEFKPGAVFANIVLGDEINRASPKTQSALLECMEERQVTIDAETRALGTPFMVIATQNPVEHEGTYPLPEAQLDRFLFKVLVPFPSEDDLIAIMDRTTGADAPTAGKVTTAAEIVEMQRLARAVPIAPHVTAYAVSVLAATHPDQSRAPQLVREYVRYGASPRGAQALVTAGKIFALLDGRFNVAIEDIRAAALPSLRHRIILNFEGEAEGITTEAVVRSILDTVAPPSVE
jgi:MoxR-like ATPase